MIVHAFTTPYMQATAIDSLVVAFCIIGPLALGYGAYKLFGRLREGWGDHIDD